MHNTLKKLDNKKNNRISYSHSLLLLIFSCLIKACPKDKASSNVSADQKKKQAQAQGQGQQAQDHGQGQLNGQNQGQQYIEQQADQSQTDQSQIKPKKQADQSQTDQSQTAQPQTIQQQSVISQAQPQTAQPQPIQQQSVISQAQQQIGSQQPDPKQQTEPQTAKPQTIQQQSVISQAQPQTAKPQTIQQPQTIQPQQQNSENTINEGADQQQEEYVTIDLNYKQPLYKEAKEVIDTQSPPIQPKTKFFEVFKSFFTKSTKASKTEIAKLNYTFFNSPLIYVIANDNIENNSTSNDVFKVFQKENKEYDKSFEILGPEPALTKCADYVKSYVQ